MSDRRDLRTALAIAALKGGAGNVSLSSLKSLEDFVIAAEEEGRGGETLPASAGCSEACPLSGRDLSAAKAITRSHLDVMMAAHESALGKCETESEKVMARTISGLLGVVRVLMSRPHSPEMTEEDAKCWAAFFRYRLLAGGSVVQDILGGKSAQDYSKDPLDCAICGGTDGCGRKKRDG